MSAKFMRATQVGALLVALALPETAQAEALVLKCTIRSGYFPTAEPGVHYYKIDEGKWLQWQESSKSWADDYCTTLNGDHAKCLFDDNHFSASSRWLNVSNQIRIDRVTGEISASSDIRDPAFHTQSNGTCERSTDPPPPPPPPPPKKF